MKYLLLFFVFTLITTINSNAIELYKTRNSELSLETKARFKTRTELDKAIQKVLDPDVKVDILGNFNKKIGVDVSFKLDSVFDKNSDTTVDELIYTAEIWTKLSKNNSFKVGRFKVPFSEELFQSKSQRAYLSHSKGSNELSAGLDLGAQFTANKLFENLKFELGVFNGAGDKNLNLDFTKMLFASKSTLSYKLTKKSKLKLGYGLMYKLEEGDLTKKTLGQSVFGELKTQVSFFDVKIFSEYLEQRYSINTLNHPKEWSYSFFNALSVKWGGIETYVSYEFFEPNSRFGSENDENIYAIGANLYFIPGVKLTSQWVDKDITLAAYIRI